MASPKFTILTASYNQLPYIGQCIRSVMSQDYPNWEMIIVDDCSNDRTFKRAKEIVKSHNAKSGNKILVYKNKTRQYCGSTYVKLLSLATGEYCGVVDGDDVLLPQAISTIVKSYRDNPKVDFIWTKHSWGNTKMDRFRDGLSRFAKKGTIYDSENGFRHIYSHWRTFKTEMRDRGPLFSPIKCTVDKDLGYNLELFGQGAFLPKVLYHYRYHRANMSHNSAQKTKWREVRKWHKHRLRKYKIIKL